MGTLYNLVISFVSILLVFVSIGNKRIREFVVSRKSQKVPHGLDNCIWIHCASLGEFEQGRPVIEKIKNEWPDIKIVLTFFSSSGYNAKKDYKMADWIGYLPIDTRANALQFINQIKPALVIFVKYEFWYNYMTVLNKAKIPFIYISSYWWPDHFLLKPWNRWLLNKVFLANKIFVQDEPSKNILISKGYSAVIVSGDTRIDRVIKIKNEGNTLPYFEQISKKNPLFIAGSTWSEDEKILRQWFESQSLYKVVIVPHDIQKEHINDIIKLFFNHQPTLYSTWDGSDFQVLIVDKIGILNSLYQYSTIAYVGGGFGKGIHNTLEAVVYGKPVIFGPNYKPFKEAADLINEGVGFSINGSDELNIIIEDLNSEALNQISLKALRYLENNKGATEKIIGYIKSI